MQYRVGTKFYLVYKILKSHLENIARHPSSRDREWSLIISQFCFLEWFPSPFFLLVCCSTLLDVFFSQSSSLAISEKNFVSNAFTEAEPLSQTVSCLQIVKSPKVLQFQQDHSFSVLHFRTFARQISQKYCRSSISIYFFSVHFVGQKYCHKSTIWWGTIFNLPSYSR